MSNKPLVSVALITYNQEQYIGECLDGMIMQKLDYPWEIVIGEDCSTDNTRQICIEYKEKYPNLIRLAFPEKNLGMMGNWIHTITNCKGKYIAICEGDDYWTDEYKLQKQVDFLERNSDFVLCAHAAEVIYSGGERVISSLDKNELTIDDLLLEDWGIMTASIVFKKDALHIPYWYAMIKNGDMGLQLLLALEGKVKYLSDKMSVYRQHPGGISATLKPFNQAAWLTYLLYEFNKHTKGKYSKQIKKRIKRMYKKQLHFSTEYGLRKATTGLLFFQVYSLISPFAIRGYRK